MQKISGTAILILFTIPVILCCCSAGCIFTEPYTTDIVIGNKTVGTVTVTPTQDLFSFDTSAERFTVEVEIFDLKFTKNGVSRTERDSLLNSLTAQNPELSRISQILNGFESETVTKQTNAPDDFLNQLINMKLSANSDATLAESLNLSGTGEKISDLITRISDFVRD